MKEFLEIHKTWNQSVRVWAEEQQVNQQVWLKPGRWSPHTKRASPPHPHPADYLRPQVNPPSVALTSETLKQRMEAASLLLTEKTPKVIFYWSLILMLQVKSSWMFQSHQSAGMIKWYSHWAEAPAARAASSSRTHVFMIKWSIRNKKAIKTDQRERDEASCPYGVLRGSGVSSWVCEREPQVCLSNLFALKLDGNARAHKWKSASGR